MKLLKLINFGVILTGICLVPTASSAQEVLNTDKVLDAMELLDFSFCTDTVADEASDEIFKKLCDTYLTIYNTGKAQGQREPVRPYPGPFGGTASVPPVGSGTSHTGGIVSNWVPAVGSETGLQLPLYRRQQILILDGVSPETLSQIQGLMARNDATIEK